MASGNYTQNPLPQEPEHTVIPPRASATRQLPALPADEERRTSRLPVIPEREERRSRRLPVTTTREERRTSRLPMVRTPRMPEERKTLQLPEAAFKHAVDDFRHNTLSYLPQHLPWLRPFMLVMLCVVLGAIVLITAGIFQRPSGLSNLVYSPNAQSYAIQVGGSANAVSTWQNSNGPIAAKTAIPTQTGPYSVIGKPTITADFINRVLAAYHSPAAGKGQALYNLGVQYGIDPAFALAFFMHESTFGTAGMATTTLSLGNLRCIPSVPCNNGYAQFSSWEQGFEAWYKLIRNLYVAQWGLVTVDQIIPTYAPSSDHNNVSAYIASLKHSIDTWHAGVIQVT